MGDESRNPQTDKPAERNVPTDQRAGEIRTEQPSDAYGAKMSAKLDERLNLSFLSCLCYVFFSSREIDTLMDWADILTETDESGHEHDDASAKSKPESKRDWNS